MRMAVRRNTYEAVLRVLSAEGIVVLHKGQAPLNPVNLFDTLVSRGRRITIEVDDTFVEEIRRLADGNSSGGQGSQSGPGVGRSRSAGS